MGEQRAKKISEDAVLAEAEKQLANLEKAKAASVTKKAEKIKEKKETAPATPARSDGERGKKAKKTKKRSAKYQNATAGFDKLKYYPLHEAINWVKKTSYSRFDGSVELIIKISKKKNQQGLRKLIELPYGTGKKIKIIILDEAKIVEIKKTKKIDFDVALATPEIMPRVAQIAKILGPKGKMPNPKSGTITADPERTKKELEGGKIEVKETSPGMIQQLIGKVSWEANKLQDNIEKIISIVPKSQLKGAILSATMGPGVKVKI